MHFFEQDATWFSTAWWKRSGHYQVFCRWKYLEPIHWVFVINLFYSVGYKRIVGGGLWMISILMVRTMMMMISFPRASAKYACCFFVENLMDSCYHLKQFTLQHGLPEPPGGQLNNIDNSNCTPEKQLKDFGVLGIDYSWWCTDFWRMLWNEQTPSARWFSIQTSIGLLKVFCWKENLKHLT